VNLALLQAANANVTGPAVDSHSITDDMALEVVTAGTVTAFSVQLQGSEDSTNWQNIGSAVTTVGTSGFTGTNQPPPFRYFRAVLSGYTGTGTVSVTLAVVPGV
jgi:hypothetical protein